MLAQFYQWLPPNGVNLLLVLFLSFLVGFEREERKTGAGQYVFGGVRTFPLIGLVGYVLALISRGQPLLLALGFVVVGTFLALSYWHKLVSGEYAGITSEMSGLTTYLVGALVYEQQFWIATAVAVANLLLLELKSGLERLTRRIAPQEVLVFAQFLFLTAVILPVVPNQEFTQFQINPFRTWLVVAAVSAVSYGSYVLQRATKARGGLIMTAILGGAYSSTVTTIAIARKSVQEQRPHLFSGCILMASGVMYLRVAGLLGLFNVQLMARLAPSFLVLAAIALAVGWFWSRRGMAHEVVIERESEPLNPLEMRAALAFAVLFVAMLIATHLTVTYLGQTGLYLLAGIMGVTDVDPFIMGMTQAAGGLTPLQAAATAILIATACNNVVKGIYAYALASRSAGIESLIFLSGLSLLGITPLLWWTLA